MARKPKSSAFSVLELGHAELNDPGICSNCGLDLKSAVAEKAYCVAAPPPISDADALADLNDEPRPDNPSV